MRTVLRASSCALALVGAACDTTQPLQLSEQAVEVVLGAQASVDIYDVYDRLVDTNGDNLPDVRSGQAECRQVFVGASPLTASRTVPWRVSVDIRVVRAGSTEPQTLLTFDPFDPFASVLSYDTTIESAAPAPPTPPIFFSNGRRVSVASRDYLENCAGQLDLPDPNLGGFPLPFEVTLSKGDTIIVQARKQPDNQHGQLPPQFSVRSQPVLTGSIVIEGRTVTLAGTAASTMDSGSGVSFSYTVR